MVARLVCCADSAAFLRLARGIDRSRYVVEQLQCLGILQTCEVLKVGMPTRVTYTDLKEVSTWYGSQGHRRRKTEVKRETTKQKSRHRDC